MNNQKTILQDVLGLFLVSKRNFGGPIIQLILSEVDISFFSQVNGILCVIYGKQ